MMRTIIIQIDSDSKAKELSSVLASMNFVKSVSSVRSTKDMIAALQEHGEMKASMVKRKNKAIAKYL